ncbi:ROK family protein [Subtercola endophyticus]|uniref:ROK family protein n=1 Tax=Subtercola endophyticus TaxID=2895559 RepID=UPI001E39155E|nr:ROK family protein [Subtercola endophyticus]UFS57915.1 ROK family protein [Subtercola endophyticus]
MTLARSSSAGAASPGIAAEAMPRPSAPRPLAAGVGNSNDQTRRHNLSTILTMLHHGGAQTRAQLTRLSGLNRSTIGALVTELGDLGLAYETEPHDSGLVGRPSPIVHANEKVVAITVNPDVDAITIGVVGLGAELHKRIRFETASVPTVREAVNVVTAVVAGMQSELEAQFRVVGVGIAIPGLVNSNDGTVLLAPHLDWHDESVARPMADALGYPARAANDAGLATVAESLFGSGRGVSDLVYLNGSASGIGGGVLVGGSMLRGAQGFAGELGHTLVNSTGIRCHCGKIGCLETEVNLGRLLAVLGRDSLGLDELDALLVPIAPPSDAGAADDRDSARSNPAALAPAVAPGLPPAPADRLTPDVRAEVDRQLDVLALAIGNFISVFNPESFVLGGFLGSLYGANPERLRAAVKSVSFGTLGDSVRIDRAQLRSRLLTIGAAELAFAELLADPAGTSF